MRIGQFTNGLIAGCFDIMHPGYIRMFQDAKTVCDHLIIGLQTDPTIDRPKTKNAPIFILEERKIILSGIKYGDEIIAYSTEKDLYNLLVKLKTENRIDVRILGTDYLEKSFTGDDLDIKIYWHERSHNWSATGIRKRIIETEK